MIEAEFWDYDSREDMAAEVAGDIGFIIESAIDARGESLVAFPGGSTPAPMTALRLTRTGLAGGLVSPNRSDIICASRCARPSR